MLPDTDGLGIPWCYQSVLRAALFEVCIPDDPEVCMVKNFSSDSCSQVVSYA